MESSARSPPSGGYIVRPSANAPVMPWRPSAPGESDWAQRRPYRCKTTRRTIAERGNGRTFQAIGKGLMADGVPTARGKTPGMRPRSRP
jgi:hypothetical protein